MARKLAIRPTEIVEFLTERNIQIEDGSNTRLEDDHVAMIMQKFAPARAAEVAAELVIEKDEERKINLKEEVAVEVPVQREEELKILEPTSSESEFQSGKLEVIKAAKVELSGLKVVGKIELPEPKKKEPQPQGEELVGDQPQKEETPVQTSPRYQEKRKQENRKPYPNKRESNDRPKTNPIALQREREAIETEKRRRAQAEQEKEKRTQHYLKKVKVVAPTKSARLFKEDVEEMTPLAPIPKTWWGKFMKWLNT